MEVALPHLMPYDGWYYQCCQVARPVARPIVRLRDPRSNANGGATMNYRWYDHVRDICNRIFNRRLAILNMTVDFAATDFALVITHDIWDEPFVHSTICLRSSIFRS